VALPSIHRLYFQRQRRQQHRRSGLIPLCMAINTSCRINPVVGPEGNASYHLPPNPGDNPIQQRPFLRGHPRIRLSLVQPAAFLPAGTLPMKESSITGQQGISKGQFQQRHLFGSTNRQITKLPGAFRRFPCSCRKRQHNRSGPFARVQRAGCPNSTRSIPFRLAHLGRLPIRHRTEIMHTTHTMHQQRLFLCASMRHPILRWR